MLIRLVAALAASAPLLVFAQKSENYDAAKFRSLQRNGLIKLDTALYDHITQSPRDYSVSILLTAMGKQFNCQPCHQVQPEYDLLAKQWQSQQKKVDENHFFAVLDFVDGQQIYQRLGLQTAPTFQTFLPTEGPRSEGARSSPITTDLSRLGYNAEGISSWLKANAQVPISFSRPIDRTKAFGTVFIFVSLGLTIWKASSVLYLIASQTYIWAAGVLSIILLMNGGYMWNQIRHPPYSQMTREGTTMYIQPGYSNQYGAETHIIAACYGLLGFSAYTLTYILPTVRDPVKQRVGVYIWTAIVVVLAGVVMSIFKVKHGGCKFERLGTCLD
ncbi:BQ5605_C025g10000 [Microbotryum silenes-dioicae]|uniref:BQ5605_C025g10000 protein n=1 Tax=Microbotryum silenes-dioicae TaxID=796604 RepID=A0A2X0NF41_9BASI|nr:BQ5605_C025g10000 [Microbotryum silenes-dioicae]